jgi:phage/plasmid-related protein TIGR03299
MAHELTIVNGQAEMAYTGDEPWHGLGNKLEQGASIETWIQAAGMGWQIKRGVVQFVPDAPGFGFGDSIPVSDSHVLYRDDNLEPLGIVSSKYKVVQPAEVLEFFRDLLPVGFDLDTAGTLFGGKRFWALASIGESAVVTGNDLVNGYLLLSSSADGTLATTARFTTVRVVCNNTLSMALTGKDRKDVVISHRTDFNAAATKAKLGIATGAFHNFITASRDLAGRNVSHNGAIQLTSDLLLLNDGTTRKDVTKSKAFNNIMTLFETGKGNSGQTAWDWVNGVTEYVDHYQRGKTDDHRLVNSWYGKGDALKTSALELALATA